MNGKKILILTLAVLLVLSAALASTPLTPIPSAHATGGLASTSSVQLDASSTCSPTTGVCTKNMVTATLSTAATFRAGAVITGAANPTPNQACLRTRTSSSVSS